MCFVCLWINDYMQCYPELWGFWANVVQVALWIIHWIWEKQLQPLYPWSSRIWNIYFSNYLSLLNSEYFDNILWNVDFNCYCFIFQNRQRGEFFFLLIKSCLVKYIDKEGNHAEKYVCKSKCFFIIRLQISWCN